MKSPLDDAGTCCVDVVFSRVQSQWESAPAVPFQLRGEQHLTLALCVCSVQVTSTGVLSVGAVCSVAVA